MLKTVILIFITAASSLFAYKVYDLGTLETEQSEALAINDAGHVLGRYSIKGNWYLFLWDPINGLKTIDHPKTDYIDVKLNNNDHFTISYFQNNKYHSFYWDNGFIPIKLNEKTITIVGLNDNDQVLFYTVENIYFLPIKYNIYIWDKGITNLNEKFQNFGEWFEITPVAINNHGEVAIKAKKEITISNEKFSIFKSFIYSDGKFTMILPEYSPETEVEIINFDDDNNMIVWIESNNYYINVKKGIKAYFLSLEEFTLKNGFPIQKECLPAKLKLDKKGRFYIEPGQFIIMDTKDTCFQNDYLSIRDQNSKGYIVGQMNTIHPAYHAFLAKLI